MTEGIIIAICSGIAGVVAWTFKVMLRIEKRLTRIETINRIKVMHKKSADTDFEEKE